MAWAAKKGCENSSSRPNRDFDPRSKGVDFDPRSLGPLVPAHQMFASVRSEFLERGLPRGARTRQTKTGGQEALRESVSLGPNWCNVFPRCCFVSRKMAVSNALDFDLGGKISRNEHAKDPENWDVFGYLWTSERETCGDVETEENPRQIIGAFFAASWNPFIGAR